MSQRERILNYLKDNYRSNEPIFLSEISIPDIKPSSLRLQMKRLTEDGIIRRFDTGIYYLPAKTMFRFVSSLSPDEVIRKKFLYENGSCCGYVSGMMFANQLGLTTQVPLVYEVYTNKATTDYRDTTLGNSRIVVRRPYVEVNNSNVAALQFLDLLKEVSDISELKGKELTNRLTGYMKAKNLSIEGLRQYFPFYPDRIYRNMFEAGLLNGVAT